MKYMTVMDLPLEDGKPKIDENNLQDYSDEILETVLKEVDKTIEEIPGYLAFPFHGADMEGRKNWKDSIDEQYRYYEEKRGKLQAELISRKEDDHGRK